jgi:DNA-binding response OmpR family regulator/two-component sensor histidine kinase
VAEEAKENKLRLFTDLSHEFRTVVTLITNPIQDLIDSTNDETIRNKLKVLQKSSERLARLTDGILRFRRLDENKYSLTYFSTNISAFIANIIDAFTEQANKKNIKIHSDIPAGIYAEFDLGVMEKIIYNLLSNAIKYTKKSGLVSVSLKAEDSKILIKVQDTGIGIPKTSLPFLFNRFYKVSNLIDSPGSEGIGIGLSLTKELLQLHGGQINVSSIENQGTEFNIILPQYNSHNQVLHEVKYPSQSHGKFDDQLDHDKEKSILIVEDNPDLLMVIADIIKKHYKVITARNGNEGLNLARKCLPDLILSDILMPVMDGMQMCIEIKKHQTTCHIPVVLLTAIDSQENTIKGFDLGADAYITKPFNEFLLLSNIKNLVGSRAKLKEYFCPSPFMRDLLKTKDNEDGEFLQECLNNIYENLDNENYTLDSLSDKMNMSRSSLYRKLKEITSLKPVDFIKKAKLNYAAKLLLTNKNTAINEICWRSGFSDTKYFSKCFFQEFGRYPKSYAEDIIREK